MDEEGATAGTATRGVKASAALEFRGLGIWALVVQSYLPGSG